MPKQAKDTKDKKEVDQLIKSGLVIEKQGAYYGYIDQVETPIGTTPEEILDTLEMLSQENKTLSLPPTQLEPHNQAKVESNNVLSALQVESTENEDDLWSEILGSVSDLAPENTEGYFLVLLNGINTQRATDRSLPVDHPVRTCPLTFRWNRKDQNVQNGTVTTNNGWTVLPKALAKKLGITTQRDDTPQQDFFTVKGLVLCCARKDQFLRKKLRQNLRYKLAAAYEMEMRQEMSKDAAIRSADDINASTKFYENDFNNVVHQAAQVGEVQMNGKKSAKDLMKELLESNDADLEATAQLINQAVDQGDLKNVIGSGKVGVPVSESNI